ncbi:MAG TPA: indolepyruvate ferredoxin oxidoreductase subunit alpha [Desulfosporosinus sp.]
MGKKLFLMGNEAIARGAVEAGVNVAAGYPGTPSSEVLTTLAKFATEFGFYAEWSVNEKVALEVASGASYAGARALVSMKQVGLNVAADPLMSLAYIGVKGGLVLVVADDPGPHSSQTEQDTRKFASFANLPVFDPSTPQEAKDMVKEAFELSEKYSLPVILRPTTRTCHACQDVEVEDVVKVDRSYRFEKDPKWVIMPGLSYKKHIELNKLQPVMAEDFNQSKFNQLHLAGEIGIIACGVSYNYVLEACRELRIEPSLLKIGTPYPLPPQPVLGILRHCQSVLVIEEQEPVVEDQTIKIAWQNSMVTKISGKHDNLVPREGELNVDKIKAILIRYFNLTEEMPIPKVDLPVMPVRSPVLCAGCPHRASFLAFKEIGRAQDAVFCGDIGCYTLGTAAPLDMLDTCLCMGAGISQAAGMSRVEPGRKHVAFIGDSTFFHSGIAGLVNAVYNNANITIVIMDNSTTAMTGHQPHPGINRTATGKGNKAIDIAEVVRACGVELIKIVDPNNFTEMKQAALETMAFKGPSVVLAKRECVAICKTPDKYAIDLDLCIGCEICIQKLGCPAIYINNEAILISPQCTGCGLCAQVCPQNAIREVSK